MLSTFYDTTEIKKSIYDRVVFSYFEIPYGISVLVKKNSNFGTTSEIQCVESNIIVIFLHITFTT